jgi:hypothetical protein
MRISRKEEARRAKISAFNKGKTLSEETKAKMRAYHSNRPTSHKVNVDRANRTRPHIFNAATRRRMSASAATRPSRKHSDETKAKMSEARKDWFALHPRQEKPSSLEVLFASMVDNRSFKYVGCFPQDGSNDKNIKYKVPGFTADFVSWSRNILVWLDGCRWHGCTLHSNNVDTTFKIPRDQNMLQRAIKVGWKAVRIWEHDLLVMTHNELETLIAKL